MTKFIFFDQVCEIFEASSTNLKFQKFTLKINSILDNGLCNFYKLIQIFEAFFFSISFKRRMKL